MTSKQFLAYFFAGFAACVAVIVPLNVYVDVYGVFRPTQGRKIGIYGEERIAKYLHAYRYVPENFDGVLLGSSVSDNFDTSTFPGLKIYNASINGGNVEDLLPLADNLFQRKKYKLTIIFVHRYLTLDHVTKTAYMTPRQYWSALGSPALLTTYVSSLAVREGIVGNSHNTAGVLTSEPDQDIETVRRELEADAENVRRGTASVGNYHIDPVAMDHLRDVIDIAREHSEKLVICYPPVPGPILNLRKDDVAHYQSVVSSVLRPGDIEIDFNDPKYDGFRNDFRNYIDGVHLSSVGGKTLLTEINKALLASTVDHEVNRVELQNGR